MIDLLIDTNVLIHLLHPTGSGETGLTRQLLDWDRAGYVRLCIPAVSGQEQGRSPEILAEEMNVLGLSADRIVEIGDPSDALLNEIHLILGSRKTGDGLDALMVYTALDRVQQGQDTWLITGDGNILHHAEALQALGVVPIVSLRGAVNRLKVDFPLTIARQF